MNSTFLFVFLSLFSLAAGAFAPRVDCRPVDLRAKRALERLNLPGYNRADHMLQIDGAQCGRNLRLTHYQVCKLEGHTIIISDLPGQSLLVIKRGSTYEIDCTMDQESGPQAPRASRQHEGPGHGGSNDRSGGAQ